MVKASIRKSVSATGNSGILDGHIRKSQPANHEQLEIQMYLSKLRQLVPNMPKNRKVSKVEVINNVIDYICDLQTALIDQLHPSATSATVSINNNNNNNNNCLQALMMESSPSADCPTC